MIASRLLGILLAVHASAQDFSAQTRKLQENGDKIDAQMNAMGFLLGSKPIAALKHEDKAAAQGHLFQTHGDATRLRAESGRVLIAETTNRLVVGVEGSPAILTIADNQGLFSGLKVLGSAKQGSTEGRLFIECERVIFRSGRALAVKGSVLDDAGAFGLKAQVLSSKALMIGGAIASSFISGYAASQQTQQTNAFGFSQPQTGTRNGILSGVAQTAADQSKKFIEDSTKEKPILVVEPKTKMSVYLDEEVRF